VFREAGKAADAVRLLGSEIKVDPRLIMRQTLLKEHKDGRLVVDGLTSGTTDISPGETPGVVISTGDSGVTTVSVSADDLIVEGNGSSGITIATRNFDVGLLRFIDPDDFNVAGIAYDHSDDRMSFRVNDVDTVWFDENKVASFGTFDTNTYAQSMYIETDSTGTNLLNPNADDSGNEGRTFIIRDTATTDRGGANRDATGLWLQHGVGIQSLTNHNYNATFLKHTATNRVQFGIGDLDLSFTDPEGISSNCIPFFNFNPDDNEFGFKELLIQLPQGRFPTDVDPFYSEILASARMYMQRIDDLSPQSRIYWQVTDSLGTNLSRLALYDNGLTVGTTLVPLGTMYVYSGDSGWSGTLQDTLDDLVIESDAGAGIQMLSPNTSANRIAFGDPEDDDVGLIAYSHGDNDLKFTVNASVAATIDSSGHFGIGTETPLAPLNVQSADQFSVADAQSTAQILAVQSGGTAGVGAYGGAITLSKVGSNRPGGSIAAVQTSADPDQMGLGFFTHAGATSSNVVFEGMRLDHLGRLILSSEIATDLIGGSAGSMVISTGDSGVTVPPSGSDELIIEGPSSTGIAICTTAADTGLIRFADPGDTNAGGVSYEHSTDTIKLRSNSSNFFTIDSTGLAEHSGNLFLTADSTETRYMEIGRGRSGNGYAYLDLIGDATYTDYGLRLIRNNTGPNTTSQIIHRGTGALELYAVDSGATIVLDIQGTEKLTVSSTKVTSADEIDAPNVGFMVWGEENTALSATGGINSDGNVFAFGNGGTGNRFVFPMAGEITHMTFGNGGEAVTATIEIYKNGVATGASISPSAQQAVSTTLGTPVSIAAGDYIEFRVTSVTTSTQGPNLVTCFFKSAV